MSTNRCRRCGALCQEGDRFCRRCGEPRAASAVLARAPRSRLVLGTGICVLLAGLLVTALLLGASGGRSPTPASVAAASAHPRASRPATATHQRQQTITAPTTTIQPAQTATTTATTQPAQTATTVSPAPPPTTPLHIAEALAVARSEEAAGHRIGFALVSRDGQTLAQLDAAQSNYSGSISKSMLLVAYLRQTGSGQLSDTARWELTEMIEISDNDAADWVYAHLAAGRAAVEQVAADAGMTRFQIDTSDQVYVLGQSLVTAGDFARLFARIDRLMPAAQRSFGMYLLAHVQERVGLLAAGLPGAVYAKEGWKPEPDGLLGSPYIVNQAAQFNYRGQTYGVAVTVGAVADQADGEDVVRLIVSALL